MIEGLLDKGVAFSEILEMTFPQIDLIFGKPKDKSVKMPYSVWKNRMKAGWKKDV